MSKDKGQFDFNANWYDIWMKQTKDFFDSAEHNLQGMFKPHFQAHPEEHIQQINQWIEALKKQWQQVHLNEQQKAYEKYWKMMFKMCSDASDMLVEQWMQRTKEHNPIKNTRELYELWLNCCNEVYKNAMHSKSYQEAYGEWMNAAIHYWKSALHK